jgi:hypothetical protein
VVTTVRTEDAAKRLAAEINSVRRTKPYVVVSTPAGRPDPYIDPADIESQVGNLAAVFLIPTGPESWTFSRQMPDSTQVYGGAGRAYPVGTDWVHDPYRSPLRFAWGVEEGPRAANLLIADALGMAADAGLLGHPELASVTVEGTVEQLVLPSRALVRTDDRHIASIRQELLWPQVPIARVLREGMRVAGALDLSSMLYDVRAMAVPATEALAAYRPGDVVLAYVDDVQDQQARLLLHPDVGVLVRRDEVSSNDLDLVSSLMTPGEVLPARMVGIGPDWRLSLLDVDDDEEPRPAPALLRGGPAWLVPPPFPVAAPSAAPSAAVTPDFVEPALIPQQPVASTVQEAPPDHEVVAPPRPSPLMLDRHRQAAPRETTPDELEVLRRGLEETRAELRSTTDTVDTLRRAIVDIGNERRLLHNQLQRAKAHSQALDTQLKSAKTELRKARQRANRGSRHGSTDAPVFQDPEEQFRHEVYLAWARRIPAADKPDRPLHDYTLGEEFLPSLEHLDGIDHRKVVDVVVEVLTGLAETLDGREMHPLRTAPSGGAPARVRDDGATCWRVALQVKTPQARRLHFWRQKNGDIELSRVALHDDFRP